MSMCNHEIKVYLLVNKKKLFFHTQTSRAYFYTLNTWRRHWITSVNVNNLTTVHHSDAVLLWWKPQHFTEYPHYKTFISSTLDKDTFELLISQQIHLDVWRYWQNGNKLSMPGICDFKFTRWLQSLVIKFVDSSPTTIEC